ncbi:MAG TPA: NADH-quinone oxidoreductase subunit L [Actinomycetes bacterium]
MNAAVLAEASPVAASGVFSLLWLVVALPLFGAAILLLAGRRSDRWGHWLGTGMPVASFVIVSAMLFAMLGRDSGSRSINQTVYTWIPVGGFRVDMGLLLDPLSVSFALLITGVGSLIHIYSIGYMSHDPARRRFFGYLNLFVASMLLLVLANSYLTLYMGWEGVGLASYLLIGFWNYRPAFASAANKAFVMNRVGDIGLSIAIMIMFATFGTVSIAAVSAVASQASHGVLTAMGLLLLLAACGKSAQVPLQAWLGDAMAGPTPVSALIHAATMVTAGVYLIARSNAIFDLSAGAQLAVAIVGAVTLIFGAIVGSAKDDIKKSLAGSTMSQIGYMILAVGLGPIGYAFGIAHLLTHGFFKADLFLGAGSVMHGMNDEVDMRRYGGLRKLMPVTFVTFIFGYLAIIGVPPFAGYFTKDKIIEAAFDKGGVQGWTFGFIALLGAGITAFYMTRMVIMTFFGEKRWAPDTHPHESPTVMTAPMAVLAFMSLVSGALLMLGGRFVTFLEPVFGPEPVVTQVISPVVLTVITLAVVALGGGLAYQQYATRPVPEVAPVDVSPLTVAARRDLYGDVVNETLVMQPGQYLTRFLVFFDNRVVDGAVNGLAALIGGISARSRRTQTGFVRSYALSMFAGAAIVVVAVVLVRI